MEGTSGDSVQRKDPSPFLLQMKSLDTREEKEKEKRARRKKAQALAMEDRS
jgi:hypothetical protein